MGFEGNREMAAQARNDVGTHGDVGDEHAVHHVPVDAVDPRVLEINALLTQPREVGRKDGRSNFDQTMHIRDTNRDGADTVPL